MMNALNDILNGYNYIIPELPNLKFNTYFSKKILLPWAPDTLFGSLYGVKRNITDFLNEHFAKVFVIRWKSEMQNK